ncbi:hypothetical protein AAMO2058_000288400 [Amorphochlora amoebiformis]|eukprot:1374061-Amorphochlora_amoeboformis.AAC.1
MPLGTRCTIAHRTPSVVKKRQRIAKMWRKIGRIFRRFFKKKLKKRKLNSSFAKSTQNIRSFPSSTSTSRSLLVVNPDVRRGRSVPSEGSGRHDISSRIERRRRMRRRNHGTIAGVEVSTVDVPSLRRKSFQKGTLSSSRFTFRPSKTPASWTTLLASNSDFGSVDSYMTTKSPGSIVGAKT